MKNREQRLYQAIAALGLLALLAFEPVRHGLETSMLRHMLVQFPGLLVVGVLLGGLVSARWRIALARWNHLGISGLCATGAFLAVLMIPRVLDLALVDWRVETAKFVTLVFCGAALRLSWPASGLIVQGFFLGNVLPMTAVVGLLYQDSPLRLCNAYTLDDQQQLGSWLIGIAVALGVAWLLHAYHVLKDKNESEPSHA
ncbi:MAG: hypothetical protein R3F24_11240 [Gammaproteobacteria bacterium]